MKIANLLVWSMGLLVGMFFPGTGSCLAEEVVIEDTFDGDLSLWKVLGSKVKALDGKLVIVIPEGTGVEGSYVNGQISSENNEGLNFYRDPVEIVISSITMEGTAAPEKNHFGYWLGPETGYDLEQGAFLHVYIRNGSLYVQLYTRPGDGGKLELRVPVVLAVSLPIQRFALYLDSMGFVVTVEDSSGTQTKEVDWSKALQGDLLAAWERAWNGSNPVLLVQATEGMDPGDCRVTIEEIKVTKGGPR